MQETKDTITNAIMFGTISHESCGDGRFLSENRTGTEGLSTVPDIH